MSELLNSLNQPTSEQPKSFMQEVQEAAAQESAEPTPAPEPRELRLEQPITEDASQEPQEEASGPVQQAAPERDDDRKVSLKALQEERARRQEIERRLAQMEAYLSQAGQQPQEQFQEPDPETDPIGALKYTKEQLARLAQEQQARAQEAHFQNVYVSSARQFASQTPDFPEAYQYAIQSRVQELEAVGTPQHVIADMLRGEEMALVAQATQNGVNPAEAIYKFAKARGFQGKQAPIAQTPAPQVAAPDMQKVRQAVAATPAASGGKTSTPMTAEKLASLSGAAFDKAFDNFFYGNRENPIFRR